MPSPSATAASEIRKFSVESLSLDIISIFRVYFHSNPVHPGNKGGTGFEMAI